MSEFLVVGEAGNGREALDVVRRTKPDVVLLDVNMPIMGGVETVQVLKKTETCQRRRDHIKSDEDVWRNHRRSRWISLKNATPEELCKSIRLVCEGMSVLAPDVTRQVLRAVSVDQGRTPDSGLSSREMEVLECLALGKTTAQISNDLFISDNTVKTHVRHILEKLEASNRAEAVSKAIQLGLIGQESSTS
jgi:DNA-binding NarL/FixJ family response regulator